MASTYGQRHGLAGYDTFRTGLRFATVQAMLRVESEDPADWRQKSRGCVLGLWHSIKLALYGQMCERLATGPKVELVEEPHPWAEDGFIPVKRYVVTGNVRGVQLRHNKRPEWFVVVHPSPKGRDCWQVSYFDALGAVGDHERATLALALDDYELTHCYHVEAVL